MLDSTTNAPLDYDDSLVAEGEVLELVNISPLPDLQPSLRSLDERIGSIEVSSLPNLSLLLQVGY